MVPAPDLVVGLRASADVAGAAAAATGRTARLTDDLAGLLDLVERVDAGSLLVVPSSRLGVAGAMALARAAAARRRPLGFVATWLGRERVDRQLEKLRRPPRSGCDADLVFAQLGFAPLAAGPGLGDGRLALLAGTDGGLAERFSAPHRLLAVAAYGSAADAEIGRAYVCARHDAADDALPWPCHMGGLCLERRRAGAEPPQVVRMGARSVAADCLIWGVCGAVAFPGSIVAPGDSLVAGFLASERCGPVIAPCKVTELDHALLLFAAGLVRAGASLGEVALELNRASLAGSSADAPWLLLGDPAARLEPVEPAPAPIPDGGLELTARPGQVRLLRSGPDDAVVTWEAAGDAAALSRRLLVRQFPGTGHAVVHLATGDPVALTLRARRPGELPAELAQALSIRAAAGPYAALRRLLGAAARLPGRRRPGGAAPGLVAEHVGAPRRRRPAACAGPADAVAGRGRRLRPPPVGRPAPGRARAPGGAAGAQPGRARLPAPDVGPVARVAAARGPVPVLRGAAGGVAVPRRRRR
jgi:hypothetical protein